MARKTSRRRSSARRSSRRLSRNSSVADTILQQMGGSHRLGAMIGAHSFTAAGMKDALSFKWKARAKNKASAIKITLEPSDTYRVEFWSVRGANIKKVGDFDGIYEDQLKRLFETETGLYLTL